MNAHASINRIFRLIWNEALRAWVPVSEISRGRGKRSGRAAAVSISLLAAAGLGASPPVHAAAPATGMAPLPKQLPTGGTVVAGAAAITSARTPSTAVLDVDQSSQRAVIDWNTFNLGSAAQVNFVEPNSSAVTLNRVLDSNVSEIFGKITSTGQIFISNPNGVYFSKSASVDVGSLTATTDSIDNADFMSGKITLTRNGATGSVVNDGQLQSALGGYIALLAPEVRNSGVIIAHLGTVALAAGESVTLTFDGGHLAGINVTPAAIAALVENRGAVLAPGGLIILSAQAADHLLGGVVKNSGTLEATGFSTAGGRILLEASDTAINSGTINANAGVGSPAGSVTITAPAIVNSGTINAAANSATAALPLAPAKGRASLAGGHISLNANSIVQTPTGTLNASGASGGSISLVAAQDITVAGSVSAAATGSGGVGDIAGNGGATLGATGYGGGIVLTAGHDITLQSALIDASGSVEGGQITVQSGGQAPSDPPADPPVLALLGSTVLRTSSRRGKGGSVTLTGDSVDLLDTSSIDASGAAGGGNVFIGGGFHGQDPAIADAQQTLVGSGATIDASATQSGDGGQVVLWSDVETTFAGSITARGGAESGAGGTLEVSSANKLNFTGTVDAGAAHGKSGTLLLDPENITIDASGGDSVANDSAFATNATGSSILAPATIIAITDGGTAVTLQASNDIIINSSIITVAGSGAGGWLTFQAGRNITVNAQVTSDNGNISFTANDSGATATAADRTAGTIANFTNNSTIDAGTGTVLITMGTFAGTSGTIETGHVVAANLTVTQNGPTTGAVLGAIDLGETDIVNNLTIAANSARNVTNDVGNVLINGTTTIGVGTGNVTIDGSGTDMAVLSVTAAGNVLLNNKVGMQFGTTDVSGTLTETTGGPIGSIGAIQVTGAASFTANSGGFSAADPYINLSNASNHFAGGLSLIVSSAGATGGYATVADSGALNITAASVMTNLTLQTGGALTQTGAMTVPEQTILTAGAANNITLTNTGNVFNAMQIVSADNVTLVDRTGLQFGSLGCCVYASNVSGNLSVTAGGDITQLYYEYYDDSPITVGGNTTFTANAAAPINLYLGPNDPFDGNGYYPGSSNSFAGTVTLARDGTATGFTNVQLENISANASVLSGLTSVGALNNVFLRYTNAPSISLPGMTVGGSLEVYAPNVANTATTPANEITQSGAIAVTGYTMLEAASTGDIVLSTAANSFGNIDIISSRNATITDANAVVLYGNGYAFNVSGNLAVTAPGITEGSTYNPSYHVSVGGTATLTAGTSNITLTDNYDDWNIVKIPSANNVVIDPYTSVEFDNSTIAGTLTVASNYQYGGTLTQLASTAVTVGGITTFTDFNGGITLAQPDNIFGALAISGAGAINIRENAAITQASAWNNTNINTGVGYGVTLTTSNDQAITLSQAGNFFGPLILTQINTGSLTPGAVDVTETSNSAAGMTEGGAWTIHGTTTLDSGSTSIDLNNGNNVLGPLQVISTAGTTNGVASTVTIYAKSVTSADAITDVGGTGFWTTGGATYLVAYDPTGTTAGGGNVTLDNTGNVLGNLYVKAINATITENASITDGPIATWDPAGDQGWMVTGNATLIVATPSGKTISLANTDNQIGPLAISTTGTGTLTSVLITDNDPINQSAVWSVGTAPVTLNATSNHVIDLANYPNVLGNLNISVANGVPTSVAITENAAITQGSVWALSGVPVVLDAENNSSITLTNAANILGNLTVTGGAVSITENGNITQPGAPSGAWTTTGITTLNPTAGGISLTNSANVLGALAISGTSSAQSPVSITENANITQASAWVEAATPFTLNSETHNIVLSQTNQLGALTLTGADATVVENNAAGITEGGAWTIPGTTTLTAGSANPIVLTTAANSFGTVSIVSASAATIDATGGVIFGTSTITGGTLSVSTSGAITQSGAITAPSLQLIGTGNATLLNPSNNVQTLAAGFTGGSLAFENSGTFAVATIGGTSGVTIGPNNVTLTSLTGTVTGLATIGSSSAALTLTTGAALTLPVMSIAGPQTYTAGGTGITLTAGVTSTAAGAINFDSPVTLAAVLGVQSDSSAINFASTLVGASHQLTVNAVSGAVLFTGAVSGLGSTGSSAALSLSSGGATFDSTLGANNGLAVTGPVIFEDNVTLANGNAGSLFSGLVTLGKAGGMNLSGYDGMTFDDGVVLQSGPAVITSNNTALAFSGAAVSGPYGLTLNAGTGTLTGLGEMGSTLTSLTVTAQNPSIPSGGVSIAGPQTYTADGGGITLGGNVTSTAAGAITFASPVTMSANSTVTSVNSAVGFTGTVDGSHDLTVNAGSAGTTFSGAVGGITSLGNGTGAAIILQGTGATTFNGAITAGSGMTAAGAVFLDGNVTLANGGTASSFAGLVTTGGSAGNSISGYGGIAFNDGLALIGGPVSVASNGGTLSLGAPVTGAESLTLNALGSGAGIVTGLGQIGISSALTALNVTAQTLSLPPTGLAVAGPMSFTAAGGITLQGSVGASSAPATAAIAFNGPVTLAGGAITVTTNNAAVSFEGTVNGAQALTVNAGTGTTTFAAVVGGTTPLTSLATDAADTTVILGGSIDTSGAQTYNAPVTLGANTILTGDTVQFLSTLDGAHALTVNDSGTTTFAGVVGGNTPLASITVNAAGVAVNTTAVTTSGSQTYSENMALGANVSFSGLVLTFGGTIDGAYNLNVNAGGGALQFQGAVGSATPLTSLTASGNTVAVGAVTTSGAQSYTDTGTIAVSGNLGGDGIAFHGPVGVVPAAGNALTMDAGAGTLAFNSGATFNANNMTLTADQINFAGAVTGSGSLLLQPSSVNRNVAVGGSGAPIVGLNLTTADLAWLPIGTLTSLTIGSASGLGTLNVAGTLNAPLTPVTLNGGGGITQSGGSVAAETLTVYAAGNAITLANGANAVGAVGINGTPSSVSLTNTLDIDQLGSAAWNLGSAALTLNAGTHNINLINAGNTFGTVTLSGNNATVDEAAPTNLGAAALTGNLTISSSGMVTQSAALDVGGNLNVTTSLAAGDVTVNNSGATATTIGNTLVGGNYALTATGEAITQAAGTDYRVRGNLTVSGSSAVLGNAGNLVGGTTTVPGSGSADVLLNQAGVITLGISTPGNTAYTGNLTVISDSNGLTFSTSQVSGSAIALTNAANNIGGSISMSASPPGITTTAAVQTGINQANGTSVSVAGVASFTAQASSVAGSGAINLTNAGNSFGTLLLNGGTVAVTNAATGSTTIGGALATTSLTLNTAGGIAQSGSIQAPALVITAAGTVTLNNLANDVGTLAVTVPSSSDAISFINSTDLAVAGVNAGGANVTLAAGATGSLTQTAALLNVGALATSAGDAVTLTNSGNTIAALAASSAGTGEQVFDAESVSVTGIVRSATGNVVLRAVGDLTLNSGGRLDADTGNVVASTEGAGNFINESGAQALVVGGSDRWLVYSDTPDLVGTVHTVKDGLTSSFRDYDATYSTYAPGAVTEAGNGFIYSAPTPTLTVTAAIVGTPSQVYGNAPTGHLSYTLSGFVDSEDTAANTISGGTATYSTALANTMNAAVYSISYNGGLTSNYTLLAASTGAAYTVTPAVLTYTATAASRVYGAADPTLSGTIGGFKLTDTLASTLSGAPTWTTTATAASPVGQSAITGGGYVLTGSNYTFAQAPGNSTAFTITPAGVIVTANGYSMTYDGTTYSGGNGVSYSGLVNGDTSTDLGTLIYGGSSQTARNAGSYLITPSGLSDANYAISYASGSLVIGKANLTLTTSDVTKTYNGTLAAIGAAEVTAGTQLFGSDALGGGTFAFTNANAGTGDKTVTVSNVTLNDGNGGGNYNVTYVSNTASTINPANLTVDTSNVTKTYNDTLAANGTATVVSGTLYQNASNGNAQDSLSGGTYAFTDANAGSGDKTVTTSGVTVNDGNAGGNYLLTYANNTTNTINQAPLTFVGVIANKTYDGTTLATLSGDTLTGFVGTQTVDASAATANFSDKNAGAAKTVTIGGITLANGTNGGLASNYSVNPTATATATIDPQTLTVNAVVASKVYDGTTVATLTSYGLTGFIGNETVIGVYTGAANFINDSVGTDKAVSITGINLVAGANGGIPGNYVVSSNANSSANITPATLHVAGLIALNTVYDGTLNADVDTQAAVLAGVIGADVVQVGTITGTYLSAGVGTNKPIVTSALILTGAEAFDYTLVAPTGLTANVTPRSLTVSATGINKVYDGTTAATVSLTDNPIAGDVLTLSSSDAFLDSSAGTAKYISVSNITIGGANAADYTVNSSSSTYANITPANLSVSATGANKVYDGTTTAAVTLSDDPLAGDVVNLSYATAAFGNKNVGANKVVTVSGITETGVDAGDYTINAGATTTANITPAVLTVSAAGLNKVYDATTGATVTLTDNGIAGDQLSLSFTNASFANKNVGNGKTISVGGIDVSGTDAGNYTFNTTATTTADITPATLTVAAIGSSKLYDGTPAATVTLTDNAFAGDQVSLSSGPATYTNSSVGNAKTITVSGLQITGGIDMGNYMLANTTATTPGNITLDSAYTNAEITAGTIALTPALPRQLTPSVPIPAASVLDLEFPVDSGGSTPGADGSAAIIPSLGGTASGTDAGGGTSGMDGGATIVPAIVSAATGTSTGATAIEALGAAASGTNNSSATSGTSGTAGIGSRSGSDGSNASGNTSGTGNGGFAAVSGDTASNGTSTNSASGTNGSGAASGADTISQVIVTLVRPATAQLPGAVSVLVPEVIVSGGSGFSFPLPKALIEAVGSGKLQVTLKNGKRLPSWLRYASGTKMFIATALPASALPIEVLLRTGAQRWSMMVTEKSSH